MVSQFSLVMAVVVGFAVAIGKGHHSGGKQKVVIQSVKEHNRRTEFAKPYSLKYYYY